MPKLVNLGSLCIDYVFHVPNLAGAGETVTSIGQEVHPGGKGLNQSLAAARAGSEVVHVGCVGDDGGILVDVLSDAGVDVSNIRVVEGPSGSAYIQVDENGQNAIFITGGANRTLTPEQVESTMDLLEADDWLLLQNEINDLDFVLAAAHARGANIAFNVAPVDGREQDYSLQNVSILFVNEIESAAIADHDDPLKAFDALTHALSDTAIIQTLGKNGLRYGHGNITKSFSAYSVDVVDETAAGDAFIGFYMAATLRGADFTQSLTEASAAGALAVTQMGAATSIPKYDDVVNFIDQRGMLD